MVVVDYGLLMTKKEWLEHAPSLQELVDKIEGEPADKKRILVAIPVYNETAFLIKQLEQLNQQQPCNFDVLVVLSPFLSSKEILMQMEKTGLTPKFSIIWAKRKEDYGSAGGFYFLERYSVEKGYNILVEADVDCLPTTNDLIEKLITALDQGYDVAMPRTKKGNRTAYNLRFYSAIRTSLLGKAGVTFLPFFYWSEDVELFERMERNGAKVAQVNDYEVTHPFKLPILFLAPPQILYYRTRNYLMALTKFSGHVHGLRKFLVAAYQMNYFVFSWWLLLLLGNLKHRTIWQGITSAVTGDFRHVYSRKFETLTTPLAKFTPEITVIGNDVEYSEKLGKTIRFENANLFTYLKKPWLLIKDGIKLLQLANKSVLIIGSGFTEIIMPTICLLSKQAAHGQNKAVLREQSNIFIWLGILILTALAMQWLSIAAFLLTILAFIIKPKIKPQSYGVKN